MLEVRALGGLEASIDGAPVGVATQKALELLCYLLLRRGRPIDRAVLAEHLWPMRPPGKARRSLSTALWRLRCALRAAGPSKTIAPVLARGHTLALESSCEIDFDVWEFERRAAAGLTENAADPRKRIRDLEVAAGLYGGPLLHGACSDWCLAERERMHLIHLRTLKGLLRGQDALGAFEQAIDIGHRLLAIDPLQEDVHRDLMRCYASSGQRCLALEQYEQCRRTLRSELRLDPMEETRELERRIRSGAFPARTATDARRSRDAALLQFQQALETLEASWQTLHDSPVGSLLGNVSEPPPPTALSGQPD